jgi:hypothetical protein
MPLAGSVVTVGILSISAVALSAAAARERTTPPPARRSGRSASAIMRAMRCTLPASARGRLSCGARADGASTSPSTGASWMS